MSASLAIALLFVVHWPGLIISAVCCVARQRLLSLAVIGAPRSLWLGWLGGALMSAIALASVIKTETSWGWTWKGRSLGQMSAKGDSA